MYFLLRNIFNKAMIIILFAASCFSQDIGGMYGKWELVPQSSSEIALYNNLNIDIQQDASSITIIQKWGKRRSFTDTLKFQTDGKVNKIPIYNRVWPTNVFMGISMKVGASRQVKAYWDRKHISLKLDMEYPVLASQGEKRLFSTHIYTLLPDEDILLYEIKRKTRTADKGFTYYLKREGSRQAFYMNFPEGDWQIDGKLPVKAFLISLQGAVNMDKPRLYFIYPETYSFTYTQDVFTFYKNKKYFTFDKLNSAQEALNTLVNYVNGYIVWDKNERTSLIVAYTVAGLERAVVVTEDMIPMVEKAGLKMVKDFRDTFTGKSDAEIYKWAYEQYWDICSKDLIVWLGGPYGNIMKPGVADWGMYNHVFFNDLSTKPEDKEEYALACKILEQMNSTSLVMGWHSYGKDLERDHVTLVSHYGHRVEGLHTLPNMSFSH